MSGKGHGKGTLGAGKVSSPKQGSNYNDICLILTH